METIHPQKLYQKNSRYTKKIVVMTHVHQIRNILIIMLWNMKRDLWKCLLSSGFYFTTLSSKCSKNNQKEEIEYELVEFDHGYETNDNTDFRIETSNNYPLPFNEFYISQNSFNPIQDGPFWGCSRMGETKRSPSLKSVTHILQWWSLAQLYLA